MKCVRLWILAGNLTEIRRRSKSETGRDLLWFLAAPQSQTELYAGIFCALVIIDGIPHIQTGVLL